MQPKRWGGLASMAISGYWQSRKKKGSRERGKEIAPDSILKMTTYSVRLSFASPFTSHQCSTHQPHKPPLKSRSGFLPANFPQGLHPNPDTHVCVSSPTKFFVLSICALINCMFLLHHPNSPYLGHVIILIGRRVSGGSKAHRRPLVSVAACIHREVECR